MLCNRCGHELPSDTPVCPQCGPVTLGGGYAPPPPPSPLPLSPLPSIDVAPVVPPLMPMPSPAAPVTPNEPAAPPPFSPAAPTVGSKADLKRARKERAREAMAARERSEEVPTAPEDETPLVALERPTPVTQMAVVDIAVGAAKLVVASSVLAGQIAGPTDLAMRLGFGALLLLAAGYGLWTLRPFGRYAQFAVAAAALYSGVLLLAVAIPIVIYLARPGVALLLGARDPGQLDAQQRRRIREDTQSPRLIPIAVGLYALLSAISLWSPLRTLLSR